MNIAEGRYCSDDPRYTDAEALAADLIRHVIHRPEDEVEILKAGWPDFLVVVGDHVHAVEVKSGRDELRENQSKMHHYLAEAGLTTVTLRVEPEYLDAGPIVTHINGFDIAPGRDPDAERRARAYFGL